MVEKLERGAKNEIIPPYTMIFYRNPVTGIRPENGGELVHNAFEPLTDEDVDNLVKGEAKGQRQYVWAKIDVDSHESFGAYAKVWVERANAKGDFDSENERPVMWQGPAGTKGRTDIHGKDPVLFKAKNEKDLFYFIRGEGELVSSESASDPVGLWPGHERYDASRHGKPGDIGKQWQETFNKAAEDEEKS